MMNKNLLAFLYFTLIDYGLPEEFEEELLKHSCKGTMLAARHRCTWDKVIQVLTMEDDRLVQG